MSGPRQQQSRRQQGGPEDDPYPEAYSNQAEFDRMMRGAFRAGDTGDDSAVGTYPASTPMGRLLRREYERGQQQRKRRERKQKQGLGFVES